MKLKAKAKSTHEDSEIKKSGLFNLYYNNLHILMLVPLLLVALSGFTIYEAMQNDGTMIYRDISLKGGLSVTLTIPVSLQYSAQDLYTELQTAFPDNSFSIQELQIQGDKGGFIIDTDVEEQDFLNHLSTFLNSNLESPKDYTTSYIAPSLSQAFFTQALQTLLISFVLMTVVIFLFFRKFIPSIAIILSILFDIVATIGILNLLGVEISIAGIGALLMLIGYSIDTDILLTNRIIKEEKGRKVSNKDYFKEKFYDSFKTGMLMGVTTLSAATAALFMTNSPVIYEIVLIIIVGLIIDMISTWIQNAFILRRWYENLEE